MRRRRWRRRRRALRLSGPAETSAEDVVFDDFTLQQYGELSSPSAHDVNFGLCYDSAVRALGRIRRALWGISQEITWAFGHLTFGRTAYLINVVAYRFMAISTAVPRRDHVYYLETRAGLSLYYRRNRGDIQGIREILIDEIYRLPNGAAPTSLVDLGANIGIATAWLCHEYSIKSFAAVEPIAENFALLEKNCQINGLRGELICAAVGPRNGETSFDVAAGSNMGRVAAGQLTVPVRGVEQLVSELAFGPDLLKMDIEGMERGLLMEVDPHWIAAFSLVVMEMHPEYVSVESLVRIICEQDFSYFEPAQETRGVHRSKRERLFVHNPCTLVR